MKFYPVQRINRKLFFYIFVKYKNFGIKKLLKIPTLITKSFKLSNKFYPLFEYHSFNLVPFLKKILFDRGEKTTRNISKIIKIILLKLMRLFNFFMARK